MYILYVNHWAIIQPGAPEWSFVGELSVRYEVSMFYRCTRYYIYKSSTLPLLIHFCQYLNSCHYVSIVIADRVRISLFCSIKNLSWVPIKGTKCDA